ncbi:MAG TPA: RsmE family RNA methyltransferase [Opitutales bacterium]|nr:RsmE family RNA methyltransferase [Opitutales bacterium]
MNLVLFETTAEAARLDCADARARHIRDVLRMKPGDKLFVGVVNGPRGQAVIAEDGPDGMRLEITWEDKAEPPRPIFILTGLPRPQTARDVLRESAAFGVSALHFFNVEKGEPSYANSSLWKTDEWKQRLREGAAQAFATSIPEVAVHDSLRTALEKIAVAVPENAVRLALDVYEAGAPLSKLAPATGAVVLALGAERGWSAGERQDLRGAGFALAQLGPRVLRTETALVAGLSVLLARQGVF